MSKFSTMHPNAQLPAPQPDPQVLAKEIARLKVPSHDVLWLEAIIREWQGGVK